MQIGIRMSIAELQNDAPAWIWIAERYGFGWRYIGECTGQPSVTVQAFAVVCGPSDDDYATQWRVDNGQISMSYPAWILDETFRDLHK